jgi:site-specific DNA recombinase
MKTAIAYVRVSTEEQAAEGVSLEAQRAKVEAWAMVNDLGLAAVYVDAGLSGKRADNRPQLQAALDHACRDGAVLVVYSLSRLARSTKDTITISERLEKHGADLVSLSEKIDTTTAAGKMVFRMLAVLAEFERDQISERTTVAMRHKQASNERVGKVPFGFDLASDGISLVPNENEKAIVGLIRQLRADGESLRAIAAELNRRQITTKDGKAAWSHSTIQRIVERAA